MRNANAFSFRPTVEQLTDRTMPSVTLIHADPGISTPDTAVYARTRTAEDTVTVKPTSPVLGRKAGGEQTLSADLTTTPVLGRKAGEGQKDW